MKEAANISIVISPPNIAPKRVRFPFPHSGTILTTKNRRTISNIPPYRSTNLMLSRQIEQENWLKIELPVYLLFSLFESLPHPQPNKSRKIACYKSIAYSRPFRFFIILSYHKILLSFNNSTPVCIIHKLIPPQQLS